MRIRPIRQPHGSNLCGQACVAMVAGTTLEKAIDAVGTRGKTRAADLARGLARFGLTLEPRRRFSGRNALPGLAIVMMRFEIGGRLAHWVVWDHGRLLDPSPQPAFGYFSSYLAVRRA